MANTAIQSTINAKNQTDPVPLLSQKLQLTGGDWLPHAYDKPGNRQYHREEQKKKKWRESVSVCFEIECQD